MPRLLITIVPAAAGVALLLATTSASFAMSAGDFLSDAVQGDNSEVLLGQLAATKGATDQVKTFGKTLVDDHSQHRSQAEAMIQSSGRFAPTAAYSEAGDELAKLNTLSGKAFDREFADYMVEDHRKDISDYQLEASSARGPVAEFAAKSLPILEKHLQMAQAIAKAST